jgi:hypothetical protein
LVRKGDVKRTIKVQTQGIEKEEKLKTPNAQDLNVFERNLAKYHAAPENPDAFGRFGGEVSRAVHIDFAKSAVIP